MSATASEQGRYRVVRQFSESCYLVTKHMWGLFEDYNRGRYSGRWEYGAVALDSERAKVKIPIVRQNYWHQNYSSS